MSILVEGSFANPTTELWLKNSSTLGATYSESIQLKTGLLKPVASTPFLLGSCVFPSALLNGGLVDGWVFIRSTFASSFNATLYISTSATGITTDDELYTNVSIASGNNFYNLSGLQCASGSTTIYLWLNASSVPDATNGITIVPYIPNAVNYSSMPTNNWTTGGFQSNPNARILVRGS
jgi:hypothetical protein